MLSIVKINNLLPYYQSYNLWFYCYGLSCGIYVLSLVADT